MLRQITIPGILIMFFITEGSPKSTSTENGRGIRINVCSTRRWSI